MIEALKTFLLIMGLNIPVYLELYKHVLKNKALAVQILITAAYWAMAFTTQTISAFIAIIFLYFAYYRKVEPEDTFRDISIWRIESSDVIPIVLLSGAARCVIMVINLVYVIVLDLILKYDIKAQEIVTYYTQAEWWLKGVLAVEIVLMAPMVEEFVFRFFLYDKLLVNRMPKLTAAVLSAALFAIVHFNLSGIPTFFGLGLFCAFMYERKGYWGAVIAHGISNAITLILLIFF